MSSLNLISPSIVLADNPTESFLVAVSIRKLKYVNSFIPMVFNAVFLYKVSITIGSGFAVKTYRNIGIPFNLSPPGLPGM
jgi:hypothetical protein